MIEDIPRCSNFYTVEIVNDAEKDLASKMPIPFIYKMMAIVMLRSVFKPGQGLRMNLELIIVPIAIPEKHLGMS